MSLSCAYRIPDTPDRDSHALGLVEARVCGGDVIARRGVHDVEFRDGELGGAGAGEGG